MNLCLVGLNHRTAPVEVRELFAFPEEVVGEALYQFKKNPLIQEGVILSTCHRVEVYAVVTETQAGCEALSDFFLTRVEASFKEKVAGALYVYQAEDCIRHLLRVASSLDAMVVGEPQILGQTKEAFDLALRHEATGVILNKVFQKAISVAKRVRTETKIAEHAVSISFAAVELAKKIFGKLHQKSVMLLGAGEMAELAARHFLANGVSSIFVVNRSDERALELASEYKGIPVKFEDAVVEMVHSDIVLCSTGAPHYLIGPAEVAKVIAARQNRPIFFIDISVPRNIDPAINQLDNVFLYDIDDLKLSVDANIRLRQTEAVKAEAIVLQETEQLARWFKSLSVVPTIVFLKEKAEAIRQKEMADALTKLSPLTASQQEVVEELTLAIINKLLHGPLTALKEEASSRNGTLLKEAVRKLFLLEEGLPPIPSSVLPMKEDEGET